MDKPMTREQTLAKASRDIALIEEALGLSFEEAVRLLSDAARIAEYVQRRCRR